MSGVILPPHGWYPDPSGAASVRYWDGARWTNYRSAPTPPQMSAPHPMYVVSGPNHAVHLILSLVTCGMWLPVWLIIALVDHRTVRVVNPGRQSFTAAHPVLVVFGGLFGVLIVIAYWRVALPLAVIGLIAWGVVVAIRRSQRQAQQCRQAQAQVAARADIEHQALMRGDLRTGTFGQFQPAPGFPLPPAPVWMPNT